MNNRNSKITAQKQSHDNYKASHPDNIQYRKRVQQKPKKNPKKTITYFLIISIVLITTLAGQAVLSNEDDGSVLSRLPIIGDISRLIGASNKKLDADKEGRTNILIIGVGGEGHEGPNLADTIMIVSLDKKTNSLGMISIPRDLLIPIPNIGVQKINHANALGEARKEGTGAKLTTDAIENTIDIPIHYYVRVNFEAFESVVDTLGGIDINVPHSFSDPYYPLGPNQTQNVSFTKGQNHFDGATALKYARSRYTTSDFDRAKRQQEILKAIKEKTLKVKTWLNPTRAISIWKSVKKNTSSNLKSREIQTLIGLIPEINTDNSKQIVFTDAPDNYLFASTTPDGAFVLLPKERDYSGLAYAANHLFDDIDISHTQAPLPKQTQDEPTIIIHNGTGILGLAAQTAKILESNNFIIKSVGNANSEEHTQTIIYDFTYGERLEKLAFLKSLLEAKIAPVIPDDIQVTMQGVTDFYIILGNNTISS